MTDVEEPLTGGSGTAAKSRGRADWAVERDKHVIRFVILSVVIDLTDVSSMSVWRLHGRRYVENSPQVAQSIDESIHYCLLT